MQESLSLFIFFLSLNKTYIITLASYKWTLDRIIRSSIVYTVEKIQNSYKGFAVLAETYVMEPYSSISSALDK